MAPTALEMMEEENQLMAVWPDFVRDLTDGVKILNNPDVEKWMAKVLEYNVPNGKKIRGLMLVYAYKLLTPSNHLTEENIRVVRILAWCLEVMQAFIIMMDDMLDGSLHRRGQSCWYRHNNIGVITINDGVMLENSVYYTIRKYFKEKDYYINILDAFHDNILKTLMGQCLDVLSANLDKKPNLELFTMNRYNSLVEYKTSYCSFLLPVTLAMQLIGIKDPEMDKAAKTISLKMGHIFTVQDDYLDCFGDTDVIGNDIQEGKCTWLIVVALQRATSEQRKILEECYGSSDPEKVKRVKQLYIDLDLPSVYSEYEEESFKLLNVCIQEELSSGPLHSIFLYMLKKYYRRVK